MDKEALVYVDLDGQPHLVGRLWGRVRKDKESATFEYDKPSTLFGQFSDEQVTAVSRELDAEIERVLRRAAE